MQTHWGGTQSSRDGRECFALLPRELRCAVYIACTHWAQALGPAPGQATKFLLAFNVPEDELAPAPDVAAAPEEAAWRDLHELLAEAEGQPVAGNQLVAVLRQLQQLFKR